MKLKSRLLEARFIDRPNRFLTRAELNGNIVESHLPDPGRLKELLIPGARILLKQEDGENRRTKFSTQAVYNGNTLISLNTLLPNKFAAHLLIEKELDFLKEWQIHKKEITYGKHRFDFLLKNNDELLYLEVKSVTLVENEIAKFPDAVTERGRSHVEHLGKMALDGIRTMVLFVVQRHDAKLFQPQWERDPKFGFALYKAWQNGLEVRVIHLKMNRRELHYLGEIPAELNPNS
ncbi:MAG: DNA/RNA nuclease SfsA [Candidatus Marinimicrobia bacterium]|nr:DNA/RNA nuclease SfsA [Candidatus Neomarinimicrobiota bacterium]